MASWSSGLGAAAPTSINSASRPRAAQQTACTRWSYTTTSAASRQRCPRTLMSVGSPGPAPTI